PSVDCNQSCAQGEICSAGRCVMLPQMCPPGGCPQGSYCDLSMNRCVAGCLRDMECSELQTCTLRQCAACPTLRGNCDRAANDACETDLGTDRTNCGTCGHTCPTGRGCAGGMCQCSNGRTDCGGTCIDTTGDKMNCSRCGNACQDPA